MLQLLNLLQSQTDRESEDLHQIRHLLSEMMRIALAVEIAANNKEPDRITSNPIIQPVSDEIVHKAFFTDPACRWLKDSNGRVIWVSDNYEAVSGIPRDFALGRTVAEIFGPEVSPSLEALDERARQTGDVAVDDLIVPCGNNLRWIQWMVPLPDGTILGSAISVPRYSARREFTAA